MKTMRTILFKAGILTLIMMFTSCIDIFDGNNKGLTFLVATGGNTTTGLKSGLYTMKVGKKEPTFTFVSEYRRLLYPLRYRPGCYLNSKSNR